MEIIVNPSGGEKRIPLKIGEGIENHVSEMTHEEIQQFVPENTDIERIGFEFRSNEEIESFELNIPRMVDIKILDGKIETFSIQVPDISVTHAQIIDDSEDSLQKDVLSEEERSGIHELPAVPEVTHAELSDGKLRRYESLTNEGTQPYIIRKTIFEEGKLTRGELKERLQEYGYDSIEVGKTHTGVNSTLRVLDNFTNEIERDGRGEDKILKWKPQ